jgi:acetolactate decarboxylase
VRGTLVGFRSPAFVKGINQVGYHFHFLTDDQRAGGHALSFQITSGTVEIGILRQHSTFLPDTQQFLDATLPLP